MAGAIGDSIKRKEDPRLLRGEGVYAEDIQVPGMLWVHFVRSIHAHARILDIDATEALAQPGVKAVLTGKDIHPRFETYPVIAIPGLPEVTAEKSLPPFNMIATDKVRHVGEIVAIIVAEERYIARDVEDLVRIDYEVLPGAFDPEEALRPDAPQVHDDRSNEAMLWRRSTPNVAQAFEEADVIVRERFVNQRIHGVPMEPRAGVAHWGPQAPELVHMGQHPNPPRPQGPLGRYPRTQERPGAGCGPRCRRGIRPEGPRRPGVRSHGGRIPAVECPNQVGGDLAPRSSWA